MDMHKFAELGKKGVLALMSDSTNVEKPGTTGSESSVGPAIKQAVGEAKGRVVLATFASNVSRIQQAIDAAVMFMFAFSRNCTSSRFCYCWFCFHLCSNLIICCIHSSS